MGLRRLRPLSGGVVQQLDELAEGLSASLRNAHLNVVEAHPQNLVLLGLEPEQLGP